MGSVSKAMVDTMPFQGKPTDPKREVLFGLAPNIISVSTLSVVLLGVASWKAAKADTLLMICLVGGMLSSVLGMLLRWLSYQIDKE